MKQSIAIVVEELLADEEFRSSFLRNPRKALWLAGEWGVPLTDSEIGALLAAEPALWDRVAEDLIDRMQQAA